MKKLFFLFLLLLAIVACTSEYDKMLNDASRAGKPGEGGTFYATIEDTGAVDSQTKVFADDQMRVLWNADDRIAIFDKRTYGDQYRFDGSDGATAGSFTKIDPGTFVTSNPLSAIYAVYPYDQSIAISNSGVISLTLPANQTYKAESFGLGANTMVSVSQDNYLMFKNLGGYLSLKLYGDGVKVKSITLTGNHGEKLAGVASVVAVEGAAPTLTMGTDATEVLTLDCGEGVTLASTEEQYTEFWLVVPPTTFDQGFTVTVTDDKGGVFTQTTSKSVTISRNSLSRMEPLEVVSQDTTGPHFSEAVELICFVFRLMGANEYNTCQVPRVYESADSYFASMKSHRAVTLAQECRQTGVAYDAVTAFGLHLVIDAQGKISFNPNYVEGSDSSFDRWTYQQKQDMLEALNDFYTESHFHEWYLTMESARQEALDSFNRVGAIDYDWFDQFFGPIEHVSRQLILSFFIGNHNNGLSVNLVSGGKLLSPVMGCLYQNGSGNIIFSDDGSVLVHEFSHPYCNPLIEKYWNSIAEASTSAFKQVETQMRNQAYGSAQTMMCETFVRASTVRYFMSHTSDKKQESRIKNEENRGFLLVRTLVETLEKREQEQAQYATMEDFMPEIIKAVNEYVPKYSGSGKYDEYTYPSTPNLLPGYFSISETEKVQFTKGNLYWNGSDWKFEDNQMNFPTSWDSKHVGHFHWSTTAAEAIASSYNPSSLSTNDHFFCDGSDEAHTLTVEGITGLRVLGDGNNGEFDYLLKHRINASQLNRFPVDIKSVGQCLVLAPDGYVGTIADSYDADSWAIAEAEGLVCLPPTRYWTTPGYHGVYWTGTPKPDSETHAYMIHYEPGHLYRYPSYSSRSNAYSLRLVKDVEDSDPGTGNTNIVFEDASFKAYCVDNFDTNEDGEISLKEAAAVPKIEVCTDTIASMQGIEHFVNLTRLVCKGTRADTHMSGNGLLESLDVSHNTALTYLDCSMNQLTALDISNNTALKTLNCSFNQMTALDVSHNTALKILSCWMNKIAMLDVTLNTALESLSCQNNQLKELDVSHNTALTNLSCHINQLTALDVSHNIALSGLSCYYNPLKTLDVSHNTALTYLQCYLNQLTALDVSHNTALTMLLCDQNQLTEIDVSHNPALNTLWCHQNKLTTLDVSNNTALTELSCQSNPNLTQIWLKTGQTIENFTYDADVATVNYK